MAVMWRDDATDEPPHPSCLNVSLEETHALCPNAMKVQLMLESSDGLRGKVIQGQQTEAERCGVWDEGWKRSTFGEFRSNSDRQLNNQLRWGMNASCRGCRIDSLTAGPQLP